jgi:hypothetical protein
MSNKVIILIVGLFVLIVAGMFGFAYLKNAEAPAVVPNVALNTVATADNYGITRIEAKHFLINGVHTIVGEVSMPTACDLLTGTSTVAGANPPVITFDFSIINNSTDCVKKLTAARFKVSATAGSDAQLKARFMSKDVDLNLTEAAPGETPDSYELFIKG